MRVPEKGNPSRTDALGGEVQEGFDEQEKLSCRLVRYGAARKRALINLAQLDERIKGLGVSPWRMHLEKIRPRLARCGHYLGFRNYYTVGKVRLTSADFCKTHLLCPLCAIRRAAKSLDAYLQRYRLIQEQAEILFRVSLVTLTVKNGDELQERFEHLRKSVQRLLKRRRKAKQGKCNTQFGQVAGLVGTYEVTNKGKGWHPHAHLVVLHNGRFDYRAFQAEWLGITGDSHVVNVSAARHPDDPAEDFLEVFKYSVKFSDLTPDQNFDVYAILRGKRLLFSAGLFWGVKVPESMLDEGLDDLPYVELFYRYLPAGYSLAGWSRESGLPDSTGRPNHNPNVGGSNHGWKEC